MKKSKKAGWLTLIPIIHIKKRRICALPALRIEPGRKLVLGSEVHVRGQQYTVIGLGYEHQEPVVHLRTAA